MSRLCGGVVFAVCLFLLSACGTDEGFTNVRIPAGYLRIVNTIPDSPSLNVRVNDRFLQSVNFGASTAYLEVLPDLTLDFTVRYVQGEELVPLFTDEPLFININHEMTVFLTGTLDSPRIVTTENPPQGTTAEITQLELQFGHFAANSPDPVRVELKLDTTVVSDVTLAFGELTGLTAFDGGNYTMTVYDAADTVLWESGNFNLFPTVRGIFALEDHFGPGSASVRMVSIGDQSSALFGGENLASELRIANMTPDRGPLDVYINDTLFAENISFGEITGFAAIANGSINLKVRNFGDAITILGENTADITSGSFHTIVLTGLAPDSVSQLYINDLRPVATRASIAATNAAPSFLEFDIYVIDPGTSVNDAAPILTGLSQIPSSFSAQRLAVEGASYDLVITTSGEKTIVYGPQRIDVGNGGVYGFYITDTAGGGGPIEVVFSDDFN